MSCARQLTCGVEQNNILAAILPIEAFYCFSEYQRHLLIFILWDNYQQRGPYHFSQENTIKVHVQAALFFL